MEHIVAHFQPVWSCKKTSIAFHEVLARKVDEKGHIFLPDTFLPTLSEQRFAFTQRILDLAFNAFNKAGAFSINLTVADIACTKTLHMIREKIEKFKAKDRVILELVESFDECDHPCVERFIQEFHQEGYRIAIDDFGAGYLSLKHLEKMRFEYLKISGILIQAMISDFHTLEKLKTIVSFAQERAIDVIAEHVSDRSVFEACKALGIDLLQGFYLAKPQPYPSKDLQNLHFLHREQAKL